MPEIAACVARAEKENLTQCHDLQIHLREENLPVRRDLLQVCDGRQQY